MAFVGVSEDNFLKATYTISRNMFYAKCVLKREIAYFVLSAHFRLCPFMIISIDYVVNVNFNQWKMLHCLIICLLALSLAFLIDFDV